MAKNFVSFIAWLCFAATVIFAVGMMQEQSARVACQNNQFAAEQKKQLVRLLAEKNAVEAKLAEAKLAEAKLAEVKVAAETARGGKAGSGASVESLQAENEERRQRMEALNAELKELLAQPVGAAKAAAPTVATADRVKELETMRTKWAVAYGSRMSKLQAELIGKMVAKNPVPLQKFYLQYIHSPFAPAALFAAAEAWYQQGAVEKARLNYASLIAAYPESEYCTNSNMRLLQLGSQKLFQPLPNDTLHLYKPVDKPQ